MKKPSLFFFLFCFILTLFLFSSPAKAADLINKFGIHILSPNEIFRAAELVNSSGGDWGWVTLVIRDDQRDKNTIQKFFDDCRELHLIPLIRLATHQEKDFWVKPKIEDVEKWANFLNNLNWPTKNRYVIIFNEPNQSKEWGGEIKPQEYAQILYEYCSKLNVQSSNFKILNAGFDLVAPNSKTTMEALKFWQEMNRQIPGIFNKLDGWASHSYSLNRDYRWERNLLQTRLAVRKDLLIFITEAGWPMFENIWLNDDQVVGVTPFVLNYPQAPFTNFSWLDKDGNPKVQYETVKKMPKVSWWPKQEFKYELEKIFLPPFLPTNSTYSGKLILKNTGQSIWGEQENLNISDLKITTDKKIKPGESAEFQFELYSGSVYGQMSFFLADLPEFKIWVLPSSTITKIEYNFWQKLLNLISKIFRKAE